MRDYPILGGIDSPEDLKAVDSALMPELCAEIREFLIESISKTGGHLASNLGAVELTVAVHRVFSSPRDGIMFDVGHQAYVHKMLTGRKKDFGSLRALDGLSGFLRPAESEHDCFVSGHASNAISAGLGLIRARQLQGLPGRMVCIVGDGALTGGMAYEALNDAGQSGRPLVVIFNDNAMSIGRNVGALAKRLAKIRLKPRYFKAKSGAKAFLRRFGWGERAIACISAAKARMRTTLLKESIFELMGFRYLGPADGHDVAAIEDLLREAEALNCPVVVHLKTVKGKGYYPSEKRPGEYHGVPAFDTVSGPEAGEGNSFSQVFGQALCRLAEADGRICAVTAAMERNTGLTPFAEQFPTRFFDVGIAEGHAVTLSAGLAKGGMKPVCAVYSTFLQRGYDQLLHDVGIGRLPVVLAVDRAGLVGEDGETHQGAFDIAYLLSVPGMAVLAPASYMELGSALEMALELGGPAAVRYPRGGEGAYQGNTMASPAACLREGGDLTLVAVGTLVNEALAGAQLLSRAGIEAAVVKVNRLDGPVDGAILGRAAKSGRLVVLEDGIEHGGYGQKTAAALLARGACVRFKLLNLGSRYVKEGKVKQLYRLCGLDAQAVFDAGLALCCD